MFFLDQSTVTRGDIDFSKLKSLGTYKGYPHSTQEQIIKRAADAEIVITNKAPMTGKVICALEKLRLITIIATGYNNVDLQTAKK